MVEWLPLVRSFCLLAPDSYCRSGSEGATGRQGWFVASTGDLLSLFKKVGQPSKQLGQIEQKTESRLELAHAPRPLDSLVPAKPDMDLALRGWRCDRLGVLAEGINVSAKPRLNCQLAQ
jgi:hypothetical protein